MQIQNLKIRILKRGESDPRLISKVEWIFTWTTLSDINFSVPEKVVMMGDGPRVVPDLEELVAKSDDWWKSQTRLVKIPTATLKASSLIQCK